MNLTFPEDYSSVDLAGADVVFTVSVNSIKEAVILNSVMSWFQHLLQNVQL